MKPVVVMVGSFIVAACLVVFLSGFKPFGLEAGKEALKAATLSDEEVKAQALHAREHLDSENKIADKSSPYAQRMQKMVKNLSKYDGLDLNYEVYLTEEINAFALADGTIRMYSGLMDMMTDDEVLFIIGHEIGHVKLGHHKKSLQMAYAVSATRKGAVSAGGETAAIAASKMGAFAEKLINAQFSQSEEKDADDYGLKFLLAQSKKGDGAVSSLGKLAALGDGSHSIFSSHPDSKKRAQRLASQLK